MYFRLQLPLFVVLLAHSAIAVPNVWKHTNALRTIDLTKSYVRESLAVIIENVSSEPQDQYHVPFESDVGYCHLEVREKGASSSAVLPCKINQTAYQVTLSRLLAPGEKITLSISATKLKGLMPRPAKMDQNGQQYLVFTTSKHIPSLYFTLKEKTKIKFPNADIPDYSDGADIQGNSITYGPFEQVEPQSLESRISVRFEHTIPIPVVTYFERDIEVSHWGGNIAFEDRYALTNVGAPLAAQFDRIAFAQSGFYNPKSVAIKALDLPLLAGSRDAYFTDEIGNVSTSKFRSSAREANLEIRPRYPIFGGWNYTFNVGWNNKLGSFLTRDGTRHVLRVPFIEGADHIVYEDMQIRVILPEGATNIQVDCPIPISNERHGKLKTFMDTIGRSVVLLEAQHLASERVKQDMTVTYEYARFAGLRKPLVVIGAAALTFSASAVVGRIL